MLHSTLVQPTSVLSIFSHRLVRGMCRLTCKKSFGSIEANTADVDVFVGISFRHGGQVYRSANPVTLCRKTWWPRWQIWAEKQILINDRGTNRSIVLLQRISPCHMAKTYGGRSPLSIGVQLTLDNNLTNTSISGTSNPCHDWTSVIPYTIRTTFGPSRLNLINYRFIWSVIYWGTSSILE